MIDLELRRWHYGSGWTLGMLRWGLDSHLYTCEDGWHDNKPMLSCIPDGDYAVKPRFFHRGKYDAFEILAVPGRDSILIHRGNTAADVTGCVVVGTEIGALANQPAVLNSSVAWLIFFPAFQGREFKLSIRPEPPLRGTS